MRSLRRPGASLSAAPIGFWRWTANTSLWPLAGTFRATLKRWPVSSCVRNRRGAPGSPSAGSLAGAKAFSLSRSSGVRRDASRRRRVRRDDRARDLVSVEPRSDAFVRDPPHFTPWRQPWLPKPTKPNPASLSSPCALERLKESALKASRTVLRRICSVTVTLAALGGRSPHPPGESFLHLASLASPGCSTGEGFEGRRQHSTGLCERWSLPCASAHTLKRRWMMKN